MNDKIHKIKFYFRNMKKYNVAHALYNVDISNSFSMLKSLKNLTLQKIISCVAGDSIVI